jgi:HEAT repeat protein
MLKPNADPNRREGPAGEDTGTPTATEIDELLDALASPDGMARRRARDRIVALGAVAVPGLVARLEHGAFRVRWEAAKALGAVGDPAATDALLRSLHDRDQDVRWLAAEALAAIGRPGAVAVVETLLDQSDSGEIRGGVHHVLHEYRDDDLRDRTAELLDVLGRAIDSADLVRVAEQTLARLRADE